jgi:pimeloyl-ACP methyl ester carboxylesterase
MYIVQFQEFGKSDKVLEANTEKAMRYFYRKTNMKLAEYDSFPPEYKSLDLVKGLLVPEEQWPGMQMLSEEEVGYYTEAFTRSGWEGGINWYRNFSRNWQMSEGMDQHIHVPCLMVAAADDIVLRPSLAAKMGDYIDDLESRLIEDCGHWTQIEQTEKLNSIMLDWLSRKFG